MTCRPVLRRLLVRLAAALLPVGLLVACASADAPFLRSLDRHGIPYRVPMGKAILVNIPAQELIAFESGTPVFRSRVIVGTPWHPTPIIETYTTTVRFRPTWRPTPSMVASGEYVDRVWPPGEKNPLGLLAVRLEEGLLVYLHDTNQRHLFDQDYRALSHGCIRVQKWDRLAAWILDMPEETVREIAHGRQTQDVETARIPVSISYFLTFLDDAGVPVRYPDIYSRAMQPRVSAAEEAAPGPAATPERPPACSAG